LIVCLQVRAPYKVEHPTQNRIDTVFDCPQTSGTVPPMGSIKIPVSYIKVSAGQSLQIFQPVYM